MTSDQTIKSRKTQKVLANKPWEIEEKNIQATLDELLDLAAHAPFHLKRNATYDNKSLNGLVPWRFYTLDTRACRQLAQWIQESEIKAGIITNMLFAADALLLASWLPEPNLSGANEISTSEPLPFDGSLANMEHIAASSVAVQNVLLGATARGIPSYWSTGGVLRQEIIRTKLSIPMDEILLGAIFLYPKNIEERDAEIKPGKLRELSKEPKLWSKAVSL